MRPECSLFPAPWSDPLDYLHLLDEDTQEGRKTCKRCGYESDEEWEEEP